jgi:hypothetical protein
MLQAILYCPYTAWQLSKENTSPDKTITIPVSLKDTVRTYPMIIKSKMFIENLNKKYVR